MAHHAEPMDVDSMDTDFDNKENTFHHGNMRCTEKGYEELDVSELNMKLRYSVTPASSPMSKSYTACPDNRHHEADNTLNCSNANNNLTRSLNSTMTKNDSVIKSLKSLPLQSLHTEQFTEGNGNASVLRQLDSTRCEDPNITVTITETNDNDENLSLPSSSSSALHTPEATTPTKEIKDGGSPIMRGLKSVLSMFRSSQSPVPPVDENSSILKQEMSLTETSITNNMKPHAVASTPIATHRAKDGRSSKQSSPYKDSIVFNEDLEKELNWKNDTTLNSSPEKIPIQKMLLQSNKLVTDGLPSDNCNVEQNFNATVEYMDVSNNDTVTEDKTITEFHDVKDISTAPESDCEFVDCETTLSKNESYVLDVKSIQQKLAVDDTFSKNESYVLDVKTVQEILSPNPQNIIVNENTDKTESHFQSNITNVSFTDLDFKNDGDMTTMPTDYADYSKCTSDILSELEKVEANISSEVDTKINENIIHENVITEPPETREGTSLILHDKNLYGNQAVQSQNQDKEEKSEKDRKINLTEVVILGDVIAPETYITSEASNILVVHAHQEVTEVLSQVASAEENSKGECFDKVDLCLQSKNEQAVLDTTKILDTSKTENVCEELISQGCTNNLIPTVKNMVETVPFESQNDLKSIDISNFNHSVVTSDNVNDLQNEDKHSVDINVIQNDISQNTMDVAPGAKVDSLNISDLEVPIVVKEKPSDVPLPDDDDIGNELETIQVPALSAKTFAITSEMHVAVNSQEQTVVETVSENEINNLIEIKVDTETISSSEVLTSQPLKSEEFNKDINFCEYKSETIPENVTSNVHVLPEVCDMSLDENNSLILESSVLCADVVDTTIATNDDKGQTRDTSFNNAGENSISPTIMTNEDNDNPKDALIDHVSDNTITPEATASGDELSNCLISIDGSQQMVNMSDISAININPQHVQTCADEPMDISMNVTLNTTQDLPDLVNQTIVMTDIVAIPSTDDQSVNVSNVHYIDNLPKSEPQITGTEPILDSVSIIPAKNDNNSLKLEENIVESLPVNEDIKNVKETENILLHRVLADSQKDEKLSENDELPPKIFTNSPTCEPTETQAITIDEEVIVSANNSPYVSLMSGVETKTEEAFEEIEIVTRKSIASSPPIVSKGYNFNFDEIDDPFATKTKIRLSPPLDTPTKIIENNDEKDVKFKVPSLNDNKKIAMNRRRSQPAERKKPTPLKKKLNASFDAKNTTTTSVSTIKNEDITEEVKNDENANNEITKSEQKYLEKSLNDTMKPLDGLQTLQQVDSPKVIQEHLFINENKPDQIDINSKNSHVITVEERKLMNDSVTEVKNEIKTTSSSEQSTYYSAGGSSTESIQSKNVFNLPEIDDMNFNPFATKSKIRQSPPPSIDIENPFVTKSKISQSPPPCTDMDNPFATKTMIRNSPDKLTNKTSQLELNRTASFDESKITHLVKGTDDDDKMETELMEKDTSVNTTCTLSSKTSDNQNLTTREVNTEDEDTIEGPFLDVVDDNEKLEDFAVCNDDMMQFNEIRETPSGNEDNLDDEIFIDAEAFEFLLNQNKSNVVADSGKESLFLKFDPLFAKRISSDGVLASLHAHKKQSTPTKPARPSLRNEASPIAGPSNLNITYEGDTNISQESVEDANITVTKPMMVVPPALNPAVTPRNKSITPNRSNRRSITFTSPAIAVIDRLLSMSSNNSLLGQDTTVTLPNGEQNEADLALTQLRELLAEKEISVYNLRSESNELKDRLASMENQVKNLELEGQTRLKKINELNERLAEKTKMNKSMAAVVEEYERTIASLIADIENDKKRHAEERIQLINERDEQTAHLTSMEVSFSDLHSKYEKSKQVILTCKANEDSYKKSIKDFEEQVAKMQANYEMLKQHATAKLDHANQELEKMNRAHEAEVVKLKAMIKRNQLLATSLQETLAQKTKANDELTAICDELINKVG